MHEKLYFDSDARVFLPILEKIEFSLDNSLLSAEEETKFVEVRD